MSKPDIGRHIATLNLFRESDGSHEITTADGARSIFSETPAGLKPIDHFENLIIAAARRMEQRKRADGTFREVDQGHG